MSLYLKECFSLSAQAKSLHDGTIASDVAVVQIVEQRTTLTNENGQRTSCVVILVILLQVLCQVLDAIREQGNLALCATSVCGIAIVAVLAENLFFLSFV